MLAFILRESVTYYVRRSMKVEGNICSPTHANYEPKYRSALQELVGVEEECRVTQRNVVGIQEEHFLERGKEQLLIDICCFCRGRHAFCSVPGRVGGKGCEGRCGVWLVTCLLPTAPSVEGEREINRALVDQGQKKKVTA